MRQEVTSKIGRIYRRHGRAQKHTKLNSEKLTVRDHFGDLGIEGRTILKWTLKKQSVKSWTGFIWRRIGSSGELL
jgi:hypothetical protein